MRQTPRTSPARTKRAKVSTSERWLVADYMERGYGRPEAEQRAEQSARTDRILLEYPDGPAPPPAPPPVPVAAPVPAAGATGVARPPPAPRPGRKARTLHPTVEAAVDHVRALHQGSMPPLLRKGKAVMRTRPGRWQLIEALLVIIERGYHRGTSRPWITHAHEVFCDQTRQPCVTVIADGRRFKVDLKAFPGSGFVPESVADSALPLRHPRLRQRPVEAHAMYAKDHILVCKGHGFDHLLIEGLSKREKDRVLFEAGIQATLAQNSRS